MSITSTACATLWSNPAKPFHFGLNTSGGGASATGAEPPKFLCQEFFCPYSGNTVVALISSMLKSAVTLKIFTSDINA